MDFSKYKALFFDFDGVIADSVNVKTKAFAKIFKEFGSEIESAVVDHHLKHRGMSRYEKFVYYYSEFLGKKLSTDKLEKICNEFSRLVVDDVIASPGIPGARKMLKKWHNILPCFVISATPQDEIREIVERRRLSSYFHEVYGVPTSKKDNILKIFESYELKDCRCIFFGDAESDYLAAQSCKVDFIGIVPDENAPLLKKYPHIIWYKDFQSFLAE